MRKPILTIFYQFNPWNASIGGIQTIISYFIKYAPSDFDVRLVGTGADSSQSIRQWQVREWEGRSLKFFPLIMIGNDDTRARIPTSLRYTWALRQHDFASDFMHFHRIEPTLMTSRWTGEKTLFIHNDIQQQMARGSEDNAILWQRFPWVYFGLERFLIPQFSQIYSCNSNASNFYKQRYPSMSSRVSFFQNAVDTEVFFPLPEAERQAHQREFCCQHKLLPDTKILLFAGRLHPQKDPLLLVQSMAALESDPVHLLMVGEGELSSAVQAEIEKLGLTQKISMLGSLPSEQLASLYKISSGFVLSSVYEGLPITVLEALASGVPIISTRCGETPKLLLPKSGIIVDQRTPQAIAAAISHVLTCPEQYDSDVCVSIAQASSAQSVITRVYEQMFERWSTQAIRG